MTIHEAKTHLSRLIQRVLAGEEITVARGREPVIKLIPFEPVNPKRRELGWLAHESPDGRDIIGPAFWEPLSDAEMGLADHDDDPLSPTYRR